MKSKSDNDQLFWKKTNCTKDFLFAINQTITKFSITKIICSNSKIKSKTITNLCKSQIPQKLL